MTMTANESEPFASLRALEHASDALIASLPEDERSVSDSDGDTIAEQITLFINQATRTGTVLDAPDDRKAAQALVDFWLAKRDAVPCETRSKQRLLARANTLLKPFDVAAVTATVAEGDKVLASLKRKDDESRSTSFLYRILFRVAPSLSDHAASYQDLARRMLLRTVRMSEGDGSCGPVAVRRDSLLSLGDPKRTIEVLEALIASGVLRAERNESGDLISLRYQAMMREWDTLRALTAERVDFRDTAVFWNLRARSKRALASAGQANKALADYADLNALERVFIADSSSYSRNKIIAASIVCAVAVGVFGYVSKYLYDHWAAAQQEAEAATAVIIAISTDDVQLKEQSIRKLASFGKPLNFQSKSLELLNLKDIYVGAKPPAIAQFFRSAIVRVNLAGAILPYASFSQSKIDNVKFPDAELSLARFDEAVITKTDFSGATLYRAIFDYAQFNDVNNFSNTDLRSASFRNVGINGDLTFTGTAWWLAFGWTLPQIKKFADRYPDPNINEAIVFKEDIKSRKAELDSARVPEDRVRTLNSLAWTYAIYGADLSIAKKYAQDALAELDTITAKSKIWIDDNRASFTDTEAYIWLQEGQPEKAVELFERPGIVGTNSQGDLIFKYAVALHALALEKKGDDKERLEQKAQDYLEKSLRNRNYVPSHELYLLRRYIREDDEFKAKLTKSLSKEAN